MNINFKIEDAVFKRTSVRNYSDQEVSLKTKQQIKEFIDTLSNPFNKKVDFHFLDSQDMMDTQKLGTYGVIKGAKQYIGTTISNDSLSLVALGYELEVLILYLASLDIGTCWLGGTFNRKGFKQAMNVAEDKIFPAITPYGYAASKKHIKEVAMRKLIKADNRKPSEELFFKNDFTTPLSSEEASDFRFALEMVRLGPSASNKQPWRIVIVDNGCHFYEYKEPGYSSTFPYDIQRLDLGIAVAHFDLAIKENTINGHFDTNSDPKITMPKNIEYVFSWMKD